MTAAVGAACINLSAESDAIPILDAHIHLFDPTRPQGVPWPSKQDSILYRPALPARYRKVTAGLNIVGAIAVECSPWLEDNQWVLDIARNDRIIVGLVGDLDPAGPSFSKDLERFHRNPLFRGIRYGNLWGRSLAEQLSNAQFISNLRMLADAGLELDSANPDLTLIAALVRLTDLVPDLRVVIDHLPQLTPPEEARARRELDAALRELGERPQVYVKVSEVLRRVGDRVPTDLNFYRARLDELWETFGEDRLIYGSDWPNSDHWASYPEVFNIVHSYFTAKGPVAARKYFWENSTAVYRWTKRAPDQPSG